MAGARRDVAGGIAGLVWLLQNHGGAVEADLQRFYGRPLAELGRTLTWRRLMVLLRHLPSDCAVSRALHGDAALWGVSEHILAHIADLLAGANWQRGNEGAKTPSPKPEPFPRPGTQPQRPSGADMRDWARRHGQEAT